MQRRTTLNAALSVLAATALAWGSAAHAQNVAPRIAVTALAYAHSRDMIHRDIEVIIYDLSGRTTKVSGKYFAHTVLPVDTLNILNEVAMTAEIDGKAGVGWCEMYWYSTYLEHMRKFPNLRR